MTCPGGWQWLARATTVLLRHYKRGPHPDIVTP